MSQVTQSNTRPGPLPIVSDGDLTDKEGYLATLGADGVALPEEVNTLCPFVIDDGGADEEPSTVIPLDAGQNVRIVAKGTGSKGDVLVLADPGTAADKGKVRAIPDAAGEYFSAGVAEEDFVDGQLVQVRPAPRLVQVASTVDLTSTDGTAAAASTDLAALAAEAEKIGDDVRAIHAALVAQGILATS